MSTAAAPLTGLASFSLRSWSVAEYHRMIEQDIINEEDRVELLEGWVVLKMAHHPPHDIAIELLQEVIGSKLPAGWRLRIQSAITTVDSEPEPDLAVVRGDPRSRGSRHPQPQDIGLIVEVADSSLSRDRIDKARLYARAGISSYWIVNLVDGRVEVLTSPSGPALVPAYQTRQEFKVGETVPLMLDGREVARLAVQDLLP